MIATMVIIYVKPECIDDFVKVTIKNHEGSRKEPGNYRFDVLQSMDDPTRFTLYEIFESDEAIQAHRQTEHYNTWRTTVQDMMLKQREAIRHQIIRPLNKEEL